MSSLDENLTALKAMAARGDAEHVLRLEFDGDFDIAGLVGRLARLGAIGASRDVIVVNEDDKPEKMGWDGDGADKIRVANLDGVDLLSAKNRRALERRLDAIETALDAGFKEEDHPRDPDGKFGSGGGNAGAGSSDEPKPPGDKLRAWDNHKTLSRSLRREKFAAVAKGVTKKYEKLENLQTKINDALSDVEDITPEDRAELKEGEVFTADEEYEEHIADAAEMMVDVRNEVAGALTKIGAYLGLDPNEDFPAADFEDPDPEEVDAMEAASRGLDEFVAGVATVVDDFEAWVKDNPDADEDEVADQLDDLMINLEHNHEGMSEYLDQMDTILNRSNENLMKKVDDRKKHSEEWAKKTSTERDAERKKRIEEAHAEFERKYGKISADSVQRFDAIERVFVPGASRLDREFRESDHPRDNGGQFATSASGGKSAATSVKARVATVKANLKETRDWLKDKSAAEVIKSVAESHRMREAAVEGLSFALQSLLSHGTGLDQGTWKLNEDLIDHTVRHFADIAAISTLQAKEAMRSALGALIKRRQAGDKRTDADDKQKEGNDKRDGVLDALEALLGLLDDGADEEARGDDGDFRESDHPRDGDGKFSESGGGVKKQAAYKAGAVTHVDKAPAGFSRLQKQEIAPEPEWRWWGVSAVRYASSTKTDKESRSVDTVVAGIRVVGEDGKAKSLDDSGLSKVQQHKIKRVVERYAKDDASDEAEFETEDERRGALTEAERRSEDEQKQAAAKAEEEEKHREIRGAVEKALAEGWSPETKQPESVAKFASPASQQIVKAVLRERGFEVRGDETMPEARPVDMTKRAASIMFVSLDGTVLFLKRRPDAPDFPGCWDFPGGSQEGDETPEQTAVREAAEEIGQVPKGERKLHVRQAKRPDTKGIMAPAVGLAPAGPEAVPQQVSVEPLPDVDHTTFIQQVPREFVPTLNDEHVGYAWAPISSPPEPLHPGCRTALDRMTMDEVGVARAIAEGRLLSPQRYANTWLFALRVTGTEFSYRQSRDEHVYRPEEHYLTDAFLARCNGLPVILEHPKATLLDGKELQERIVGTVLLPYIAGDEVWAIARIWHEGAAEAMSKWQLSTSPAVAWPSTVPLGGETKPAGKVLDMRDGSTLLVEGNPTVIDHLAVCRQGVWDKGQDPGGVRAEARGDSVMAGEDEKKKEEEKKAADAAAAEEAKETEKKKEAEREDASSPGKMLERMITCMDSIGDAVKKLGARMDSFEERAGGKEGERKDRKRADNEKTEKEKEEEAAREDKRRKDAEEEERVAADKRKDENARRDSQIEGLKSQIEALTKQLPKDPGDKDYDALLDAQVRADAVFAEFGEAAPRPQRGEDSLTYRRRMAKLLRKHSPTWKDIEVERTAVRADDASSIATFAQIENAIYADAKKAAINPIDLPAGTLREIPRKSGAHTINEFHGNPKDWMQDMAGYAVWKSKGEWHTRQNGHN